MSPLTRDRRRSAYWTCVICVARRGRAAILGRVALRLELLALLALTALACEPAPLYVRESVVPLPPPPPEHFEHAARLPSEQVTWREESRVVASDAHTGSVVPAKHPDRVSCNPFQEGGSAVCVSGFDGPMVVTDIDFGSQCPDELMVLAGQLDQPQWYLVNPPHSPLHLHGAHLVVGEAMGLVVAARSPNGASLNGTSACSVTWSWQGHKRRSFEWAPYDF